MSMSVSTRRWPLLTHAAVFRAPAARGTHIHIHINVHTHSNMDSHMDMDMDMDMHVRITGDVEADALQQPNESESQRRQRDGVLPCDDVVQSVAWRRRVVDDDPLHRVPQSLVSSNALPERHLQVAKETLVQQRGSSGTSTLRDENGFTRHLESKGIFGGTKEEA
jgi:hypothetical protein